VQQAWAWGTDVFGEIYLVPFTEPDLSRHRTEICWPVFQTA